MCLIAFNTNSHEKYQLILIANRDEFYERPTASAEFWEDRPYILAGRDLKSLGTWMGLTQEGRIAALTNYRDPKLEKDRNTTRGDIVTSFLSDTLTSSSFLTMLNTEADQYNGFNIITGTPKQLYYYSNQTKEPYKLKPGTYGLSNHLLNTPWPKVTSLKNRLNSYLEQASQIKTDDLFHLLINKEKPPDEDLPSTGIPLKSEKQLSPIFIETETYGTRSSTVLLIDYESNVTFIERTFIKGILNKENLFSFKLKKTSD